jgi:hypothetical protein
MTATAVCSALSVTGLRKSFGDNVVLDGIDLDIGGQRLLAARPQRCRQDHRRADLLDLALS